MESVATRAVELVIVTLLITVPGCRPAAPGAPSAPASTPRVEVPEAPKGEAVADPVPREAREQADAILGRLLAGRFDDDPNLWPVARRVKGFQSCSIKSQKVAREGAVDFEGVLIGPVSRARFSMFLVKQAGGKWAIGTFSGPDPE